ncbi:MAG: nucleotide exchange factor GrpE [Acidobacteria bacterium]|nr:nucleotide exchange factor GrpE [Acidobacteriota bacterium]
MTDKRKRERHETVHPTPTGESGGGEARRVPVEGGEPEPAPETAGAGSTEAPAPPEDQPDLKSIYILEMERKLAATEERAREIEREYRHEVSRMRERLDRELERRVEEHRNRILVEFLEVMDNLELALEAARGKHEDSPLLTGVSLVADMFLKKLENLGLYVYATPGETFDPRLHEAIQVQTVDDPDQVGRITSVWQRGYKIGDLVVRPARVCVGALARPE